ncbi:hypothetical protein AB0D37_42735 [Streptomyces sp. NPDC048384]|uniref:hypothetical protein n=1 Tax=Streptomyces sp. NPDC048384 TaxID=3155487 RepID=UPI003435FAFC
MNHTTASTTSAGTSTAPEGTHFWVMSVEKPGLASATRSGTYTPPPGSTRQDAFDEIFDALTSAHPSLHGATVLFFSLEPNGL